MKKKVMPLAIITAVSLLNGCGYSDEMKNQVAEMQEEIDKQASELQEKIDKQAEQQLSGEGESETTQMEETIAEPEEADVDATISGTGEPTADNYGESAPDEAEATVEKPTETEATDEEAPTETEKEEVAASESEENEAYMLDFDSVGIGEQFDTNGLELENGELLSVTKGVDGVVVVKAKIESSYSNKATINQNYMNVRGLICDHGFNSCSELQYWAVADMQNGEESKCISFKEIIDYVYDGSIVDL